MTGDESLQLQDNIRYVKGKISEAAIRSGRRPEDIVLVAATKMNSAERVKEALKMGIDAAGENKVQELLEKYDENAYEGKPLHFIGTLQTNKVKYLIGKTNLIQSVSSLKLAAVIGKEAMKAGITQDILLEVNIGREEGKLGLEPENLEAAICQMMQITGIKIRGLMAIPPIQTVNGENKRYFDRMSQLFIDISAKKYDNVSMDYLSMGMSNDFYDAILCGSNMVRLGTVIFGERRY